MPPTSGIEPSAEPIALALKPSSTPPDAFTLPVRSTSEAKPPIWLSIDLSDAAMSREWPSITMSMSARASIPRRMLSDFASGSPNTVPVPAFDLGSELLPAPVPPNTMTPAAKDCR